MSSWLEGKVLENRAWTNTLFSLRLEAPKLSFEAGQFARLARPFSFVNAPADPVLDMLCGNPGMLKDAAAELALKGLRKNRRRTPGQITVESFW